MTIRVSATKARNNFFELLNQVSLGAQVIIERDSKEVAVLAPKKQAMDWTAFDKAAKAAHGILKDYSVDEIAPLRKRGAWKGFGQWDKDMKLSKGK